MPGCEELISKIHVAAARLVVSNIVIWAGLRRKALLPLSVRTLIRAHADDVQHAKRPEHDLGWEALYAPPSHLATMDEEIPDAIVDIVVDRPVGLQPSAIVEVRRPTPQ